VSDSWDTSQGFIPVERLTTRLCNAPSVPKEGLPPGLLDPARPQGFV